jgi:hypothetical protein
VTGCDGGGVNIDGGFFRVRHESPLLNIFCIENFPLGLFIRLVDSFTLEFDSGSNDDDDATE